MKGKSLKFIALGKALLSTVILFVTLYLLSCGTSRMAQNPQNRHSPSIPRDAQIEKEVEKTLKGMTLDDKVGQMLQLDLGQLGRQTFAMKGGRLEMGWSIDSLKLDSTIARYRVGSILNVPGTALTLGEFQKAVPVMQDISMRNLGIPTIYGLDQNHGASYVQGATIFPQPIALAATFNPSLATVMGQICAYESRAADCPWVFNPTLDLGRDPRWSRIWESYGEDPLLESEMARALVRGYQGDDPNHLGKYNVAVSVKHYFGYGAPFSGKDRTPAYISEPMLRQKYFEPFKAAIEAGALTVMVNSASINGVPVHASHRFLTEWLKEDLNWDGMILTDWADIDNLYTREKVAKDKKDAIRIAINAGIDMSMDPYSTDFCVLLKELVEEGAVSMERIDDAVRRILRVKYRLGLFDMPDSNPDDYPLFACDSFAMKSLDAALEAEILLKNNGVLPLKEGTRILLAGPNANSMRCLNGGWTYTWQGSNTEDIARHYNTIYEAMCNRFGKDNVILEQGVTYRESGSYDAENTPDIERAVAAAAEADVIVACIGENSYCETPGNLTDLWLSQNQRDLVKALAATGKPVVLILNEGRPRLVTDIEPLAGAVVDILLPGNYGADALAMLLAGDANFSGKLPYTYPKEINSLINYDYKVSEQTSTMAGAYDYDAKVTQMWPFGFGLSYTAFEYSDLRIDKAEFAPGDFITLSVNVRNTGRMAGKESVLFYSSDLVASIVPDCRRLCSFEKVSLEPGESRTVKATIPVSSLAFVGADGKWVLEKGDFVFTCGGMSVPATCTADRKWDSPNILD